MHIVAKPDCLKMSCVTKFIIYSIQENFWHQICGLESRATLGCILESSHKPDLPPLQVEDPKLCNFLDENFSPADCLMEWGMQELVQKFIQPSDTVLEFGGRYGTTTCSLAVKQNNSGALIVVEPDPKVWAIHEEG